MEIEHRRFHGAEQFEVFSLRTPAGFATDDDSVVILPVSGRALLKAVTGGYCARS